MHTIAKSAGDATHPRADNNVRLPMMPLWVNDYLGDTRHLSTVEHGAYFLLICEYWTKGKLPEDDKRLARIVGLPYDEWIAISDTIADLFRPGWRHARIDRELIKAQAKSASARESANKRWKGDGVSTASTAQPDANAMRSHSQGNAHQSQSQNQDISLPAGEIRTREVRASKRSIGQSQLASDALPTDGDRQEAHRCGINDSAEFDREWRHFRDHHVAKGTVRSNWRAAWCTWLADYQKGTFAPRGSARNGREDPYVKAATKLIRKIEEENGADQHEVLNLEPIRPSRSDEPLLQ